MFIKKTYIFVDNLHFHNIFEKDIKKNVKIKNTDMFKNVMTFVINNFGSILSINKICDYYLFVLDMIINKNVDGIKNVNIASFIAENKELV